MDGLKNQTEKYDSDKIEACKNHIDQIIKCAEEGDVVATKKGIRMTEGIFNGIIELAEKNAAKKGKTEQSI